MLIFIVASILAAFIQIGTIYLLKQEILKSYLYATPLVLTYQFLFLWGYTKAPNFLVIWFITTALTNSLAFIFGYFLYHNHISTWGFLGIILIFTGVFFYK